MPVEPAGAPITILLVDDHPLVRAGLRAILGDADLHVVGEAGNGRDAVALALRLGPRVVLVDFHLPVLGGLATMREIRRARPDIQVVILTTFETATDVARALLEGAAGCVAKDAPRGAIVRALRSAVAQRP